ncbi:MAG: M24 family metallopeptidase [Hyphomicrobiaceae bacterium]
MPTSSAPALPPRLARIVHAEYPRFSAGEMARRRSAVERMLAEAECDHLVFYGANRFGGAVNWLTGWPVTTEAACVLTPARRDTLYIHYFNHLPLARILAADADVHWAGPSAVGSVVGELQRRGAARDRVALIGPLGWQGHAVLSQAFGTIKGLDREFVELRRIKSAEELDWMRIGAWLSDLGMAAMRDHVRPGMSERAIHDVIERGYVAAGGGHGIHFTAFTPMHRPRMPVPAQWASNRKLAAGDVLFAEITAQFWDYSGQVLRTFTVGTPPSGLYRDLHDTAEAAFDAMVSVIRAGARPADVVEAAGVIEDRGFTTIDDIVHGYGGGYLPPVLSSRSRTEGAHPVPDRAFDAGMLLVIQPNVVTRDGSAGVQTGEMVLVTETGVKRMHRMPRGLVRIG